MGIRGVLGTLKEAGTHGRQGMGPGLEQGGNSLCSEAQGVRLPPGLKPEAFRNTKERRIET